MYIGIDIGGTSIRIATFKTLNPTSLTKIIELTTLNDYPKDLNNMFQAVESLATEVSGIGIGIPGALNKDKTETLHANNLKGWQRQTVVKDFRDQFKCPVVMNNDATTAALGEALFGNGLGKNFLFIIWGTGVGGTFVRQIKGQVHLISSELGHQSIEWNGKEDTCGQRGCLESYCGGRAVERLYGKVAKDLTQKEWGEVEEHFAHGLLNCLTIYPTDLIIFSGSVAVNQPQRLANIETIIRKRLKLFTTPKLELSIKGNDIPLWGAIGLVKQDGYL